MWNPWLFGICKRCYSPYFKKSEEEGICRDCVEMKKIVDKFNAIEELDRKMREENEMGKTEVGEHVNPRGLGQEGNLLIFM